MIISNDFLILKQGLAGWEIADRFKGKDAQKCDCLRLWTYLKVGYFYKNVFSISSIKIIISYVVMFISFFYVIFLEYSRNMCNILHDLYTSICHCSYVRILCLVNRYSGTTYLRFYRNYVPMNKSTLILTNGCSNRTRHPESRGPVSE